MPISHSDLLAENDTQSRVVFVSDRTVAMLLIGLDAIEHRYRWNEPTDSEWDDVTESLGQAITEILEPYSVGGGMATIKKASRSTNQGLGAGGDVAVVFDTGDYDVSNPSRISVDSDALYLIVGNVQVVSSTGRFLNAKLRLNGVDDIAYGQVSASNERSHSLVKPIELSSGDYLELIASTNGSLCTVSTSVVIPSLELVKLS